MKKFSKVLASLVTTGLVLTMVPFNAFAISAMPTRISGATAAQTAVAIADQTGWGGTTTTIGGATITTPGTAILASSTSYGMVDALTAGPLATFLKAPILLQGPQAVLDPDTKAELTKLYVETVYVTSGTAVIKQGVIDELKGMGIRVAPLGGVDKYETSVNIARKMVGVTKIAVANSIQDALSIGSIASANNEPILLTDKDVVPESVAAYLAASPAITASDIIGGTGIISDAVVNKLPSATRHWGNTAYDTNNQVIHDFDSSLKYDRIYIANGVTGIDALAGAPLAAQTKSPIFLTDGVNARPSAYAGKITTVSALDGTITVTLSTFSDSITALGGPAVLPEFIRGVSILKPNISDFTVTASGTGVTPSAIFSSEAVVTLTVPTTDQPVVYSVSYRGGDPVGANTQVTDKVPNNVKVGQNFNIVTQQADHPDYMWTYVPNNDPIKLIKETGVPVAPPGAIGAGGELISTFQATQTGSFKVQFTNIGGSKTIDYIINVT